MILSMLFFFVVMRPLSVVLLLRNFSSECHLHIRSFAVAFQWHVVLRVGRIGKEPLGPLSAIQEQPALVTLNPLTPKPLNPNCCLGIRVYVWRARVTLPRHTGNGDYAYIFIILGSVPGIWEVYVAFKCYRVQQAPWIKCWIWVLVIIYSYSSALIQSLRPLHAEIEVFFLSLSLQISVLSLLPCPACLLPPLIFSTDNNPPTHTSYHKQSRHYNNGTTAAL